MTTKATHHDTHAKAHEDKKRHVSEDDDTADLKKSLAEEKAVTDAVLKATKTPTALEARVERLERVLAMVSPEAAEALKSES